MHSQPGHNFQVTCVFCTVCHTPIPSHILCNGHVLAFNLFQIMYKNGSWPKWNSNFLHDELFLSTSVVSSANWASYPYLLSFTPFHLHFLILYSSKEIQMKYSYMTIYYSPILLVSSATCYSRSSLHLFSPHFFLNNPTSCILNPFHIYFISPTWLLLAICLKHLQMPATELRFHSLSCSKATSSSRPFLAFDFLSDLVSVLHVSQTAELSLAELMLMQGAKCLDLETDAPPDSAMSSNLKQLETQLLSNDELDIRAYSVCQQRRADSRVIRSFILQYGRLFYACGVWQLLQVVFDNTRFPKQSPLGKGHYWRGLKLC